MTLPCFFTGLMIIFTEFLKFININLVNNINLYGHSYMSKSNQSKICSEILILLTTKPKSYDPKKFNYVNQLISCKCLKTELSGCK